MIAQGSPQQRGSSAVDAPRYVNYRSHMPEILKTQEFERWIKALRDRAARVRVQARIDRLAFGNPGQPVC